MAITFVGVESVQQAAGPATVTVAVPAGTQNGDFMIAIISRRIGTTAPATPSGWTSRASGSTVNGSINVCTRVASSEPASYSFTVATSQAVRGSIAVYRGLDATPLDATTTANLGDLTSPVAAPSITTVTANAWHVAIWHEGSTTPTLTPPGTYTTRYNNGVLPSLAIADKEFAATGATGPADCVFSAIDGGAGVSLALRPAAPTGRPTMMQHHHAMLAGCR